MERDGQTERQQMNKHTIVRQKDKKIDRKTKKQTILKTKKTGVGNRRAEDEQKNSNGQTNR